MKILFILFSLIVWLNTSFAADQILKCTMKSISDESNSASASFNLTKYKQEPVAISNRGVKNGIDEYSFSIDAFKEEGNYNIDINFNEDINTMDQIGQTSCIFNPKETPKTLCETQIDDDNGSPIINFFCEIIK